MERGILPEDLDTPDEKKQVKQETKTEKKEPKTEHLDVKTEASNVKVESTEEPKTEKVFDPLIDLFYSEIDDIKSEDFKTSSKEQLERLLRPGSTYFNLNPFEVLQIDPYASIDEIKRKYRKLSIYVHPDKNNDDKERAQIAFEAVNRAYKMLEDEKERKKCLEVVDEARERVDKVCEEKRKKMKRETASSSSLLPEKTHKKDKKEPEIKIEEDDPDKYRHSIYVMTCKLFADIERLKVREMEKKAEEKKRKANEKTNEESKSKIQKEWDQNYEESRQGRVSSWQNFVGKKGTTSAVAAAVPVAKPPVAKAFFRPPKHKPESR